MFKYSQNWSRANNWLLPPMFDPIGYAQYKAIWQSGKTAPAPEYCFWCGSEVFTSQNGICWICSRIDCPSRR